MRLPSCYLSWPIALALTFIPSLTSSQWAPGGTVFCDSPGRKGAVRACEDGEGGAFLCWGDARSGTSFDVYAIRVTPGGEVHPEWPKNGILIGPGSGNFGHQIIADKEGGFYFLVSTGHRLSVARYSADGSRHPNWLTADVQLAHLDPGQVSLRRAIVEVTNNDLVVLADGFFVECHHGDCGSYWVSALLYWVKPTGEVAWRAAPYYDGGGFDLVSFPGGGIWSAGYGLPEGSQVDFFGPSGEFIRLWPKSYDLDNTDVDAIATSADGSLFLVFGGGCHPGDWRLQRLLPDGSPASGWPFLGKPLCFPPGRRDWAWMRSDGAGGVLLLWQDRGLANEISHIYATRFDSIGVTVPDWKLHGTSVCTAPGQRGRFAAIEDSGAGFYAVWVDSRNRDGEIYAVHVGPSGSPELGWVPDGTRIAGSSRERDFFQIPAIVSDEAGGAFVFWFDGEERLPRTRALQPTGHTVREYKIFGQRLTPDGTIPIRVDVSLGTPVNVVPEQALRVLSVTIFGSTGFEPTMLDLESVRVGGATPLPGSEARSSRPRRDVDRDGFVDLEFFIRASEVTRSSTSGEVEVLATDGEGYRLRGVDYLNAPGSGVRQIVRVGGEASSARVPDGLNAPPRIDYVHSVGRYGLIEAGFRSESNELLRIDLLDVGGRIRGSYRMSPPSTGQLRLDFGRGGRLSPGVYFLRIRQGGHSAVSRVAILE